MSAEPLTRAGAFSERYHGFPIAVSVLLEGAGKSDIRTGVGFLDHLLELFSRYSNIDITIKCDGDLNIDDHHTLDEVGMALGSAIKLALSTGDLKMINRNGFYLLPMDECLTTVALDLCGRSSLVCDVKFNRERIGDLSTELIQEFLSQLSQRIPMTLVVKSEYGINDHHKAEGIFKALGRAFGQACAYKGHKC